MTIKGYLLAAIAAAGGVSAQGGILGTGLEIGATTGVVSGECTDQSCLIADLAGVTGQNPTKAPEGGNDEGWECVKKVSSVDPTRVIPTNALAVQSCCIYKHSRRWQIQRRC